MDKKTEALKLALEALENSRSLEPVDVQWVKGKRHVAITAIRSALAEQPAQGCEFCLHPLYAGTKCKNCGREQTAQQESEAVRAAWMAGYTEGEREAIEKGQQPAQQQEPYLVEELQDEILRLSEIISTNAFYQAGHVDALEWAAQMAELEDPRTSDWVYDDPHELAKALRKGPDFLSSPPAAQQQEPVAWPCVIAEADFEKDTITLEMQCSDYKVGAGQHWLYASPPAQQQEPIRDDDVCTDCGMEHCECGEKDD